MWITTEVSSPILLLCHKSPADRLIFHRATRAILSNTTYSTVPSLVLSTNFSVHSESNQDCPAWSCLIWPLMTFLVFFLFIHSSYTGLLNVLASSMLSLLQGSDHAVPVWECFFSWPVFNCPTSRQPFPTVTKLCHFLSWKPIFTLTVFFSTMLNHDKAKYRPFFPFCLNLLIRLRRAQLPVLCLLIDELRWEQFVMID